MAFTSQYWTTLRLYRKDGTQASSSEVRGDRRQLLLSHSSGLPLKISSTNYRLSSSPMNQCGVNLF